MKLIKIIDRTKVYVGSDGKEHPSVSFFVEGSNGYRVLIRPIALRDYGSLSVMCEVIEEK